MFKFKTTLGCTLLNLPFINLLHQFIQQLRFLRPLNLQLHLDLDQLLLLLLVQLPLLLVPLLSRHLKLGLQPQPFSLTSLKILGGFLQLVSGGQGGLLHLVNCNWLLLDIVVCIFPYHENIEKQQWLVLDTHNPDPLISISIVEIFNLRISLFQLFLQCTTTMRDIE